MGYNESQWSSARSLEVCRASILLDIPVIWVSCVRRSLIQILPFVSTNPFFPFFGPSWTVAFLIISSPFRFLSKLGTKGTWPPVGSPAFWICLSSLSGGVFATGGSEQFECFQDTFSTIPFFDSLARRLRHNLPNQPQWSDSLVRVSPKCRPLMLFYPHPP